MDVRLPNGVVMRGVPAGTNKYTIMETAIKGNLAKPEDFGQESASPVEPERTSKNFFAGAGRGLMQTGRKVANLLGADNEDTIAEANRLDAPLMETGAGKTGELVGEIAATLPAGGVAGAGVRGAAARLLPRAAAALKASTAARVGGAALEGGLTSLAVANPGERGEQTAMGVGLGGAFGAAGKLLGAGLRASTAELTPEAIALQKRTGTFVPLSQE